jgi:uncharacterized CHY-type Zn-finger protein
MVVLHKDDFDAGGSVRRDNSPASGSTLMAMTHPRPQVLGVNVDGQTRCAHYHSVMDVIAIKMRCCQEYYACKDCHDALASHAIEVWPRADWQLPAVLCGVCGTELTVRQYLACSNVCPHCAAKFNPGCRNHYHFYFET